MAPRPKVLLNCACSLDGRIASPDGQALRLSDELDWRRVHQLRASVDAILVGVQTVLSDDPGLKVDPELAARAPGHKLLRVVLDTHGRTPERAHVLDGSAPGVVFHGPGVKRRFGKARHESVALGPDGRVDLAAVLERLQADGIRDVLVEGGGTVLRSFVQEGLADVWTIYQAPVLIGGNGPQLWPGKPSPIGRRLHVENVEARGKGILWTIRP